MTCIKKPARWPVFYGLPFNSRSAGYGRSDWIRTSDLLVPNETRYQAALRSEDGAHSTEKVLLHKTLRRIFFTHHAGPVRQLKLVVLSDPNRQHDVQTDQSSRTVRT